MEDVGNGWFRCSITPDAASAASSSQNQFFYVAEYNNDTNFSGDGYSGIYLWGAQLEQGSFPTSYIPTSGSTVTRAGDSAIISGSNFSEWYSQGEGTLYVEASSFGIVNGETNRFLCLTDGSNVNRTILLIESNSELKIYSADNSVAQAATSSGVSATNNTVFKVAGAYKPDDFAISANGGSVATDTSGTVPLVTQVQIGNELTANYLDGHIKKFAFYPKRLPNATLQAMTEE